MILVQPSLKHLDSYLDALRRGWDPNSFKQSEGPLSDDIERITRDPKRFLEGTFSVMGGGNPIPFGDGTFGERLPSFTKWMWDGEFCGRIQFRWQHKTVELPPTCLGHIGYGVAPWKRRKGYATAALRALIEEIRYCGMPYVELTTDVDNLPSQEVIVRCGGAFIENFEKLPANGGGTAIRFRIFLD